MPQLARVRARRGRVRATRRRATAPSSTRTAARCGSHDLMWQHHFEFLLLGYGAYMTFAELCKANLPDIPDQHIAQMVAGLDVTAVPARHRAAPARAARDRHRRRRGVRRGPHAGGDRRRARAERRRHARGSRSSRRSRTRGSTWRPATGSTTRTAAGSTTRAIPYASLTGHIAALQGGRGHRAAVRPHRRASASGSRPSTPRCSTTSARKAFDELLALSRTVFPYVEEHKFLCDYWFLTSWWNKIREFGDLLAAHGFLEDRDDDLPALAARGARPRSTSSC